MGIFSIFKKPPKVHDKVFGELTLSRFKTKRDDFIEGRGIFKITGKVIVFQIQTDDALPTEAQYLFYEHLLANYDEFIKKSIPLITAEFSDWIMDFEIKDFNKEFIIEGITIPHQDTNPLIGDIYFTTIHDKNLWVRVDFSDFEPTNVHIDG